MVSRGGVLGVRTHCLVSSTSSPLCLPRPPSLCPTFPPALLFPPRLSVLSPTACSSVLQAQVPELLIGSAPHSSAYPLAAFGSGNFHQANQPCMTAQGHVVQGQSQTSGSGWPWLPTPTCCEVLVGRAGVRYRLPLLVISNLLWLSGFCRCSE